MQLVPRQCHGFVFAVFLALLFTIESFAQSSAFTYQGRLTDNSSPGVGTYQMQFALYDAISNGTQIGMPVENGAVAVNNGVFTVQLDFGPSAFPGAERFLEISVRRNSSESYVTLTPRSRITSSPYAVRSSNAASSDTLSSNCVGCVTSENIRSGVLNSKKIALFRWYETNQGSGNLAFTCAGGRSLGFDGGRMWVSGGCGQFAIDVDRSLGVNVGSGGGAYSYAHDGVYMWWVNGSQVAKQYGDSSSATVYASGGFTPRGIAYDGTSMWVANASSSNVTKMRTSDGAVLATVPVGSGAQWIAFDGTFIWVSNTFTATISRINIGDNSVTSFTVAAAPRGIAYDGSHIWVAMNNNTIIKVRPADGAVVGTFAVGIDPQGVAFDGANIWVACALGNTVTKLKAADGSLIANYPSPGQPQSLAFDGVSMWVIHSVSGVIRKM